MTKLRPTCLCLSLLAGSLLTSACGHKEVDPAPSLYDRLGKTEGVATIVDGLIANVGAECATSNSVLYRSHKDLLASTQPGSTDPTRLQRLRNHFIDQLGEATGGPLAYTGKNMLVAHTGMAITAQEFKVWHNQLEASLVTNKVSAQDKAAIYAIIDKMESDVVGH